LPGERNPAQRHFGFLRGFLQPALVDFRLAQDEFHTGLTEQSLAGLAPGGQDQGLGQWFDGPSSWGLHMVFNTVGGKIVKG